MYVVPKALEQYGGMRFWGHVIYPDSNVAVLVSGVDRKFIDRLGALIKRLAAATPPRKVPSAAECRFCDTTAEDCPDRMVNELPVGREPEDF